MNGISPDTAYNQIKIKDNIIDKLRKELREVEKDYERVIHELHNSEKIQQKDILEKLAKFKDWEYHKGKKTGNYWIHLTKKEFEKFQKEIMGDNGSLT